MEIEMEMEMKIERKINVHRNLVVWILRQIGWLKMYLGSGVL